MKTLDMVSPEDPIDTTSSAAAADLIQVLDLPAALSRRLERVWDENKVSSLQIKCHPNGMKALILLGCSRSYCSNH